jgi:hypothetical protein
MYHWRLLINILIIIFKGDIAVIKANKFDEQCITYSQMNLIFNSRLFWRRFSLWIRIYLTDRYFKVGSPEEAFGRLYLESIDFGDMLRIIFGRQISSEYARQVNQYTFELRDLISAQFEGNTEGMNQHVNSLYKNIEDRATFLASINPYFNVNEWRNLLGTYLQYTIEEANAFTSGNFAASIQIFDQIDELTNKMGESFAQGLYDYMTSGSQGTGSQTAEGQQCVTYAQMNEIYNIRMFWYELAYWTRAYMISRSKGVGNASDVLARLKQVPDKYLAGFEEVFGANYVIDDVQLLNNYIDLIDALITAELGGNTDEVNQVVQNLYKNANERAALLASINPYWTQEEWRSRLYENTRNMVEEFTTFLTGDYARNLDVFSTILDQAEDTGNYYEQGLLNYLYRQRSS